MGCWNGTCMVSHLPIESGEKVKLVFLFNISTQYSNDRKLPSILNCSGFVYPNDMLSPAFFPISGKYDDYGTIKNIIKDFNYDIIEQYLRKTFKSTIKVDNEKKSKWSLNDIIRGIERGGSSNNPQYWDEKANEWKDMNFSFVFIREDVYNSAVESMKDNTGFSFRYDDDMKYETLLKESFDKEVSFLKRKAEALSSTDKEVRMSFMTEDILMNNDHIFRRCSGGNQLFIEFWSYEQYLESVINDKSKVEEVYKTWFDFRCVEMLIDATRMSWMVQAGSGSQDSEWQVNKKLSEIVIEICDKKIEERRRDYEGDWEEEE